MRILNGGKHYSAPEYHPKVPADDAKGMAIYSYIAAKRFNEEKKLMKKFILIGFLTMLSVGIITSCAQPVVGDTTAPTVTSVIPLTTSVAVPINGYITATFSEAMNPATITSTSFTVVGTTAAAGTVTLNPAGTTVIFTPSANLANNTVYTATITTGAQDMEGNALAAAYVWTFTTSALETASPAPVNLRTAGDFVLLAKTGISTTGATTIVGDLGISPAATTYLTGFSQSLDASNQFATASIVTGSLYTADMTPPTPTKMTTAISDMETAFTDAAGRTLPAFTELGAGDVSGLTLVPGLYKWGTGLLITTGVTLSGSATDVWIFQIAQDLTVSSGAMITLSGGALAKNIFWQVSGQTTLETTVDFKGIVLCQTAIVMRTGAVFNGRALAQTAITLDANAVTKPSL
ncbi:MAG: ice-binding family protein [Spirochaetes bacterium]|nr:ice-binding family protein [Spirochaetota bacterium]